MQFSLLSIASLLALASAVAVPAPAGATPTKVPARPASVPQAWDVAPAAFLTIPAPVALHTKPAVPQDKGVKREAEAEANPDDVYSRFTQRLSSSLMSCRVA